MDKVVIDLSSFNPAADWAKVEGVDGVIIRAGYRGYAQSGILRQDTMFANHYAGAVSRGLPIGIYFWSQAVNKIEAQEEADFVVSLLAGKLVRLPVYIDIEYSPEAPAGRADGLSKTARTDIAVAFCERIKALGYTPGVYSSESWFESQLYFGRLSGYSIWVAKWSSRAPTTAKVDAWQYTQTGQVPGVTGNVDISRWYTWIAEEEIEMTKTELEAMVKDAVDAAVTAAVGKHYTTLGEVTQPSYRPWLDKLAAKGYLKGRSGEGDALVIDMYESDIRALVIQARALEAAGLL